MKFAEPTTSYATNQSINSSHLISSHLRDKTREARDRQREEEEEEEEEEREKRDWIGLDWGRGTRFGLGWDGTRR